MEDKTKKMVEASRKKLMDELSKKCKGKIVDKIIRFTNDDVPKYLSALKESEGLSDESKIIIVK